MKRPPRQAHPDRIALEYRRALRPFLTDLHAVVLEELEVAARVSALVMDAADAPARGQRALDTARRELTARWSDKRLASVVRPVGVATDRFSRAGVARVMSIPLKAVPAVARVPQWTERNVALIRSIQDRYLEEVGRVVADGFRAGARWEDLAKDVAERGHVSEANAERIARTEVARLNSEVSVERFKSLGVSRAVWRTMGDERVGEDHVEREGDEFDLATGWGYGEWPGNAARPNCRCYSEPVIE